MFIYTVNFNEAIQTGIRLLVDINHLLRNTLADPKSESVPPYNKKHSATAHDMLQSTDVALDVHKLVLAVSLLDLKLDLSHSPESQLTERLWDLQDPLKSPCKSDLLNCWV